MASRTNKSFRAWLAAGRPDSWVFVPDEEIAMCQQHGEFYSGLPRCPVCAAYQGVDKLSDMDYAQEAGYSLGDPKGYSL